MTAYVAPVHGCFDRIRLRRHLARPARAHRRHGAHCLGDRRGRGLRHRRADAAGAGADRRRRAGGADHRHVGAAHQYRPDRGLPPAHRSAPGADRAGRRGADLRARRLGLHAAHRHGRAPRDRRHDDPERAAALADAAARSRAVGPRAGGGVVRLWRHRRRHHRGGDHPAVAADGGRAARRRRDRAPMRRSRSASGSPRSRCSASPARSARRRSRSRC